ncbi:MAG: haloalkane dehalogenase [Myxococcota bacterium]|jgi:haloalkane dehalogenase
MSFLLIAAALAAPPETRVTPTSLGTVAWLDARERGEPEQTVAVFVHGLPTSKELWLDVLDAMPDQPAIAVDLLDFGESRAGDPEGLDHTLRAQALDELCESLGLEQIILVAHDLGSSVAVDYMGAYGQRVERLALMSSPVYPDFEEPGVVDLVRKRWLGLPLLRIAGRAMYRSTLRKGLHNKDRYTDREDAVFRRDYSGWKGKRRMWDNLSWGTPEVFFADYPAIMKGIAVPTLVLHGAQDPFIPLVHAHRLDADIPDSELIIIEGAAHFIPLDVPLAVAEALTAFIGED